MGITEDNKARWEKMGISNDFLFGKIMRDPTLCKELLQRILPDLDIDRVEYPDLQKTIREDVDARSVRLDVYVTGDKAIYDMEMQTSDTKELPKRSRFYQSMIDLQLMNKGQSYNGLHRSYVIFICLTDVFHKGRHIYTFEHICKEDKSLSLNDGTTKIFLNASGMLDDVNDELKAFLNYVAGKKTENAFVKKLDEAVKKAKKNREWRHEFMTLLMRDQENVEKGIQEGLKQGLEQGLKKGKIYGAVLIYKDLNIPSNMILKNLQEKFHLTEAEAKKYLKDSI